MSKTSAEMLQESGLDWTASKRNLFYQDSENKRFCESHRAIVRDDTGETLGVMKKGYSIIQNRDAFEFFDKITELTDVEYVQAGSSRNGARVFIQARIPGDIILPGNDRLEKNLYLWTSHDGSISCKSVFTSFRLWCQNQLNFLFSGKAINEISDKIQAPTMVKITHKGNTDLKMRIAEKILQNAVIQYEAFEAVANMMAVKEVNEVQAQDYIKQVTLTGAELKGEKSSKRVGNIRTKMFDRFLHGKGNNGKTVWDAYNGITEYVDHERNLGAGTERLDNLFFGSGNNTKIKAFNRAVELVTVSN